MEVEGWLLDVYPGRAGEMVAWLKKDDGSAVRLTDSSRNAIYVSSSPEGLEQLAEWAEHQYVVFSCEYVNRRVNVFEYAKRPVLKLTLRDADHSERLAKELEMLDVKAPLHIFNADLMPAQTYFFEKELFPLARVRAEQAGHSIRWKPLDSVMSEDYRIPPLRKASIRVRVDSVWPHTEVLRPDRRDNRGGRRDGHGDSGGGRAGEDPLARGCGPEARP